MRKMPGEWTLDRRSLLGGACALGLTGALPGSAWALPVGFFPYPAVLSLIMGYVDKKKFPGGVVSIGKGATAEPDYVTAGTIAFDSEVEVSENTLWRIYSMTKPVTGMAAMILIDENKLKLDQPVADFIPGFAQMKVLVDPGKSLEARAAKTPITVRHLLTHTAGLGYHIATKGPLLAEYKRLGIVPVTVSRMQVPGIEPLVPAPSLKDFADRLATLPLIAEPGTKWSYSVSLDLLGRVIEVAGGMPFDMFLAKRIFEPLGMTSTFFRVPEERKADLATNYFAVGESLVPVDTGERSIFLDPPPFPFGGAGLVSNARDYDRFLAMLAGDGALGDVAIMSPQVAKLGMSNLLPAGADVSGTEVAGQGFGAGGRVGISGISKGIFGWAGAAGTVGWVDTIRKIRGGGYANYMPARAISYQEDVPLAVYKDIL